MKICLIQSKAIRGAFSKNLDNHVDWIEQATAQKPDLIVFPELSLTGYEPGLAKELAITKNDSRLAVFQELSTRSQVAIAVGAPLKAQSGIHIGMVIFRPEIPATTYSKQILHADEKPYFVPGNNQKLLSIGPVTVAPAICYESLQPDHLENCLSLGAELYIASVSKDEKGIVKAQEYYANMAATHDVPILVVNSVGYCDNFLSAGQSAGWNSKGHCPETLGSTNEGYLVYNYP